MMKPLTRCATLIIIMWMLLVCIPCHAIADDSQNLQKKQSLKDPAKCRSLIVRLDKAIDRAGIRDIQDTPIPDFSYYRVNRFLASFAPELSTDEARKEWLTRLLRLGNQGRRVELINFPDQSFPDFAGEFALTDLSIEMDQCAAQLMAEDLCDPQRIKRIKDAARVPDDYNMPVRVVGVNPVSRWFVMREIRDLNDKFRQNFQQPGVIDNSRITSYVPDHPHSAINHEQQAAILDQACSKSALSIPEPDSRALALLFDYHAPIWRIGTKDGSDRIGRPFWQNHDRIEVDTGDPVVYRYHSFTRFRSQVLLQLNYLIWFPNRPSQGMMDIFSGHLDGLIWRMTLDQQGRVLLYDSVHPCGCYHKFYPVSPHLRPLEMPSTPEPPFILTQDIPNPEKGRLVIHVSSREHYVVGLSTEQEQPEDSITYRFDDYSTLRSLAYQEGFRSMFGPDGLIIGTERRERWLTWPMGVDSAGAMRQRGHYPLSLIGPLHFDDPHLFEKVFEYNK